MSELLAGNIIKTMWLFKKNIPKSYSALKLFKFQSSNFLYSQGANKKSFRRGDLVAKEKEEYVQKYGNLFNVEPDEQGLSRIAGNESDGKFLHM